VRDIETDESDAAYPFIISLGHRLNLRVIAEGVETQEQLDFCAYAVAMRCRLLLRATDVCRCFAEFFKNPPRLA